jgi:FkbM family methyltransferase
MRIRNKLPGQVEFGLRRMGYFFYRLNLLFEKHFDKSDFQVIEILKRVLDKHSNCIDVGAHKGVILKEMIRFAPEGKHLAFEPIPYLHKRLSKKYSSKAMVYDVALSDEATIAEFHVFDQRPAYSGFIRRETIHELYTVKQILVRTETLDNITTNFKVDLVKIDVEGAEFKVLTGGKNFLRLNRPYVLFECGLGVSEKYNISPAEIFDLFNDVGLVISLPELFLLYRPPFSRDEFCGQFSKGYSCFFIAYDPSKKS